MAGSLRPSRLRVSALADNKAPTLPNWSMSFSPSLGIDARDGQRQQIFDQLMVHQRFGAAVEQPLAQARPVTGCVTVWCGCCPILIRG